MGKNLCGILPPKHRGMPALERVKAITVPRRRGQRLPRGSWFESTGLQWFLACFFGRIGVTRSPGVLERAAPRSFQSGPVVDVAVLLPGWLENLPSLALLCRLNQRFGLAAQDVSFEPVVAVCSHETDFERHLASLLVQPVGGLVQPP